MVTAARKVPTADELEGYFKSLSNWGRWGPEDQLGTLNLITPAKRIQAARLVQDGIAVSCERTITYDHVQVLPGERAPIPPLHFMTSTGEGQVPGVKKPGGSGDFFGITPHGFAMTHMDSPSHVFWEGYMYNGYPANLVTSQGATKGSIELPATTGVVSRGVLLDIARLHGVPWLENGVGVFPEDLEAAEKAQGVHVEEGDILFVRTGYQRRRVEQGEMAIPRSKRPGLHGAAMPWLHERGVAVIGGEAPEVAPSGYEAVGQPVHAIGIPIMGLWLIDACDFEDLAKACEERNRWEYQLTVAPLKLRYGTGCPVNPIALF